MRFRGTVDAVNNLKPGEPMRLIRERNNEHDRHAVMVCDRDGRHLAYVKGSEVVALANWMDARQISEISGAYRVTADRWPQVEVTDQ